MKKLTKKYVELMNKAQKATGRKEAVGLIHKAEKLRTKLVALEIIQINFFIDDLKLKKVISFLIIQKRKDILDLINVYSNS